MFLLLRIGLRRHRSCSGSTSSSTGRSSGRRTWRRGSTTSTGSGPAVHVFRRGRRDRRRPERAVLPRIGAPLVAAWLAGIIVNLLTLDAPRYYDIALRDFGLLLGALALTRLAWAAHAEQRSTTTVGAVALAVGEGGARVRRNGTSRVTERAGDESVVAVLARWEEHGATWNVVILTEKLGRRRSLHVPRRARRPDPLSDPALLRYLAGRSGCPSDPEPDARPAVAEPGAGAV